ncbi:unnamed protein product [Cuscuta epithymum]|uniref:Uncharacterized protein n=1 Tax=Cuscuta epithymum TaxID=186058 RepID=A0AAV0E4K8_9ASTE|nr:unnamed protein product [Cuscuta epithymum]
MLCCCLVCGTDKVALEFSILIAAVMILLTMYTFWATWRKYDDFTVLKPFLCSVIFVALLFTIIQIFLPQGKFVNALLFGALATILYSTMIIYYTRLTVTIYFYDDKWMEAVVDLYTARVICVRREKRSVAPLAGPGRLGQEVPPLVLEHQSVN